MCDLLGMSFERRINARITLNVFQLRGEPNPDGWGLAFYDDQLHVIKEACPAVESPLYDFMERYPQSGIYLSHVRRSTMGNRSYVNTHPFYRILTLDNIRKEWVLAHNGTITNFQDLQTNNFHPIGETDSEHIFCYILDIIRELSNSFYSDDGFTSLRDRLQEINTAESTMNLLFSDGEYLFCYSDENDHNEGLRILNRSTMSDEVILGDDRQRLGSIDLQITDSTEAPISGYIVTTRPQTNDAWIDMEPSELLILRRGKIVYPSKRNVVC